MSQLEAVEAAFRSQAHASIHPPNQQQSPSASLSISTAVETVLHEFFSKASPVVPS